ncbi:MAG: ankyrin repeat domain-containing protein [Acidobacteria bacterium]|nr:ankyrin repeat domain-containing protein [Acidobacteriota bacterium]
MRTTSIGWVAIAGILITASGGGLAGKAHAAADDPPLVAAAEAGDVAAVRDLLAAGAGVDAASVDGATALHWAVHRDLPELVRLLLDSGADVSAANRYGVQPIALAATNGSAAVLRRLLDAGADPNAAMPGGETALMTAARAGPPDAVRVLLAAGADPNARDDLGGQTAVMWAAARNNAPAVHVLAELGADLHLRTAGPPPPPSRSYFRSPEPTSFTALLFAVRAGAIDAVRALLDAGADVDDRLSDGQSALVVAAANAHWELADYLLDRGADPNLAGAGWNALHQTVRTRRPNPSGGLAGPIPTGRVDSIDVVRKLIARGVDVNARMMTNGMKDGQRSRLNRLGATAFFLAAKNTDVEAMRVLIAAGADPLIPSADGTTPLMVATGIAIFIPGEDGGSLPGQEDEVFEAVRMCVELGTDVNVTNFRDETALHGAAFRGVNRIVEYLVEQGAALDARTVEGWTPLAIANGLSYSDFFKAQAHTADLIRELMADRGLSIEGHVVDPLVCLDCYQTRPDQVRDAIERDRRMAAELAADAGYDRKDF